MTESRTTSSLRIVIELRTTCDPYPPIRSGCGTLGVPQLRRAERVDLIFAAQFPVAVLADLRHCHRYSSR
jgi:hypothetical protein